MCPELPPRMLVQLFLAIGSLNCCQAEENLMVHPNRVEIPKHIPFIVVEVDAKGGGRTPQKTLAAIDYQVGHYDGWQEALYSIRTHGQSRASSKEHKSAALLRKSCSKYFTEGLSDGYDNCMKQYATLEKENSDPRRLSELIEKAYLPTLKAPPLPSSISSDETATQEPQDVKY